jgi:hypothetical protein
MNWAIFEIIYLLDVVIFAFLAIWFYNAYKRSTQGTKTVLGATLLLTAALCLQEIYFFVGTAADPTKAAFLPEAWFGPVLSIALLPKVILTFAGAYVIYVLLKMHDTYAK